VAPLAVPDRLVLRFISSVMNSFRLRLSGSAELTVEASVEALRT